MEWTPYKRTGILQNGPIVKNWNTIEWTPDQRTGILQNGHQIKRLEYCRMDTRSKNWNTVERTPDKKMEYYRMDRRPKTGIL